MEGDFRDEEIAHLLVRILFVLEEIKCRLPKPVPPDYQPTTGITVTPQ